MKILDNYLKFWLPVEVMINGELLILQTGDSLTINKYIAPLTRTRSISWRGRLKLSLHGITVKEIK